MRAIEKLRAGPKVMELRENWSYGPGGVEKTLRPGAVDAHWLAGICEQDGLAPPELFEIDAKGPAPEPAVEASALAALRRGPPPPEIDQELFEQVRRIQVMAVKMLNENKTPDCVIVASSSPLGRETEGRVSIPTGWLKVFPDAQCPRGYEYVGLEEELFPLSSKGCQRHFLPLPCTACHAEQTWPPGGYMTAKSNPLGPNYHPPAEDPAPEPWKMPEAATVPVVAPMSPCACPGTPHAGHISERQALEALAGPMTVHPSKTIMAATCTCGASSVGSRIHSEWCDLS